MIPCCENGEGRIKQWYAWKILIPLLWKSPLILPGWLYYHQAPAPHSRVEYIWPLTALTSSEGRPNGVQMSFSPVLLCNSNYCAGWYYYKRRSSLTFCNLSSATRVSVLCSLYQMLYQAVSHCSAHNCASRAHDSCRGKLLSTIMFSKLFRKFRKTLHQ